MCTPETRARAAWPTGGARSSQSSCDAASNPHFTTGGELASCDLIEPEASVSWISSKIWPTRPLWVESGPKPLLSGEGGKQTLGHQRLCRVSGAHGDPRDQRQGRGRDQEGRFTKSDDVGRSPSQDFRQSARRPSNQATATRATRSARSESPRGRERLRPHSQRIVGRYTCMALVPEFPPSVIPPPGRKIRPPITALPLRPWTAMGRSGSLVQRSARGS